MFLNTLHCIIFSTFTNRIFFATRLEPRTTWFLNEHSTIWPNLANLAKWLSVPLRTKWFWARVQLQSPHLQISHLLWARSSLTFRQLQSVDSLWNAYMTWQEHTVRIFFVYYKCIKHDKNTVAKEDSIFLTTIY